MFLNMKSQTVLHLYFFLESVFQINLPKPVFFQTGAYPAHVVFHARF